VTLEEEKKKKNKFGLHKAAEFNSVKICPVTGGGAVMRPVTNGFGARAALLLYALVLREPPPPREQASLLDLFHRGE